MHHIFNFILSVWKCQMLFFLFDALLQTECFTAVASLARSGTLSVYCCKATDEMLGEWDGPAMDLHVAAKMKVVVKPQSQMSHSCRSLS